MVLKGQRRKAASSIAEQSALNRIARAGQAQLTPTTGITSSVEKLATAIGWIDEHIGRVAGQHGLKKLDILDELYRRNESST